MENNKEQTEKGEKTEPIEQAEPVETTEQIESPVEAKKQEFQKWKVYLVLVAIVVGAGIYGYSWLQETKQLRAQAIEVVERAQNYDVLLSKVEDEKDRCETFISQKEGDFGSFEYCKKFIDWTKTLSASEEGLK